MSPPVARATGRSPASHLVLALCVALCVAIGGLGACTRKAEGPKRPPAPPLDAAPAGVHDIKSIQYNDTNDVYRVFLRQPQGTNPLRLKPLRLAILSDADIKAGKNPHLRSDPDGPVAVLGPRFKIVVLHGVVQERTDTEGKRENVVVRAERRVWQPFLAPKLAGGKSLFLTPAVHYPPPWTGRALIGSGAAGPTREAAYDAFRRANGFLPQPIRLELEGYSEQVADDGREDREDADDAGPGGAQEPKKVVQGAQDNRIIGAVPGTPAQRIRMKQIAAEQRKRRLEQQQKKAKQAP